MIQILPFSTVRSKAWLSVLVVGLAWSAWQIAGRAHNEPPPEGAIVLDHADVTESSGIARSRLRDGLLWTHNDSGDSARLFAFSEQGHLAARVKFTAATAIDWEDMCSFDLAGKHFLAVADVGDNGLARPHVVVYGIEEPALQSPTRSTKVRAPSMRDDPAAVERSIKPDPVTISCPLAWQIQIKYPDGPKNCEAMAFDPWREHLLLITKERFRSHIYTVELDVKRPKQSVTAKLVGTLLIPFVTGADISDDGRRLALATYGPTCLLSRDDSVDWTQASAEQRHSANWKLATAEDMEWIEAPPRRQGESVCFDRTGNSLLMTSEGVPMPLWSAAVTPK